MQILGEGFRKASLEEDYEKAQLRGGAKFAAGWSEDIKEGVSSREILRGFMVGSGRSHHRSAA